MDFKKQLAIQIQQTRKVRSGNLGSVAASSGSCGRHLPDQVHEDRSVQSCARADFSQHRIRAAGTAESWLLGDLWFGQ